MKLSELKDLAQKASQGGMFMVDFVQAAKPNVIKELIERYEQLLDAIEETINRADDYGDSYLSQPVRQARNKLNIKIPLK